MNVKNTTTSENSKGKNIIFAPIITNKIIEEAQITIENSIPHIYKPSRSKDNEVLCNMSFIDYLKNAYFSDFGFDSFLIFASPILICNIIGILKGYFLWGLGISFLVYIFITMVSFAIFKGEKKKAAKYLKVDGISKILNELFDNLDILKIQNNIIDHFEGYDYQKLKISIDMEIRQTTISPYFDKEKKSHKIDINDCISIKTPCSEVEPLRFGWGDFGSEENFDCLIEDNRLNFLSLYNQILKQSGDLKNELDKEQLLLTEKISFSESLDLFNLISVGEADDTL